MKNKSKFITVSKFDQVACFANEDSGARLRLSVKSTSSDGNTVGKGVVSPWYGTEWPM
jgi:hypothetical protein